jgi:hypothetical protein
VTRVGLSALYQFLDKIFSSFHSSMISGMGVLYKICIMFMYIISTSKLLRVFGLEAYWILSNGFSVSFVVIMCFLFFMQQIWRITFLFSNADKHCNYGTWQIKCDLLLSLLAFFWGFSICLHLGVGL